MRGLKPHSAGGRDLVLRCEALLVYRMCLFQCSQVRDAPSRTTEPILVIRNQNNLLTLNHGYWEIPSKCLYSLYVEMQESKLTFLSKSINTKLLKVTGLICILFAHPPVREEANSMPLIAQLHL